MDQVQPSTNQYRRILTQFLQVPTSSALYLPSATKYQPVFERISTCRSFINLTSYQFTSGVEFDQGYLSFFNVVNWATQSWCWLYLPTQNFVNIAMGKHVTCQADHHIKRVTWKGCKSYLHECLDIVFSFFLRSLARRISIRSLKQYWGASVWQYFCLP